jgi:hypothetical protein
VRCEDPCVGEIPHEQ